MTAGPYSALLDAVRGVRWPAAHRVAGATLGAHASTLRGNSSEFSEFRPYRQGDDPRRVDWRLLARSDRAYVRLTTDRATLRTAIIIDASASMAFPLADLAKWTRAREIAVGLAAVARAESDPVGLAIGSDPPFVLAPRARRSVLVEMIRALDGTMPRASAPLAPFVTSARAPRVVLVTDLLGDLEDMLAAAKLRIASGGEVIVVHVVSPDELDPPGGALLAVDPEHATTRRTLDGAARAEYQRAFSTWMDDTASLCRAARIRYLRAETPEPAAHVVRRVAGDAGDAGR
ncbi:MAG: DUF58 domain-containing protein [Gemmatimonadaceae bacterium]|nr:DUF58 domain-containing protein [Gemmatimonadaceae bacterium]